MLPILSFCRYSTLLSVWGAIISSVLIFPLRFCLLCFKTINDYMNEIDLDGYILKIGYWWYSAIVWCHNFRVWNQFLPRIFFCRLSFSCFLSLFVFPQYAIFWPAFICLSYPCLILSCVFSYCLQRRIFLVFGLSTCSCGLLTISQTTYGLLFLLVFECSLLYYLRIPLNFSWEFFLKRNKVQFCLLFKKWYNLVWNIFSRIKSTVRSTFIDFSPFPISLFFFFSD